MSEHENVIHVRFGPGGGRRTPEPARADPAEAQAPSRSGEPYTELFRLKDVARLFDLNEGKLRYWDRTHFIQPSAQVGRRRLYNFADLVSIRAATGLLSAGIPLSRVRRSVEALRQRLPNVVRPLHELRIVDEDGAIVVRDRAHLFEPQTGQLRLNFAVEAVRDDVIRVLRPEAVQPERRKRAYEAYLEGCRLDEDEATFDEAERCYREAATLDPSLANALTNWGNLCFRRGEVARAQALYERALAVDDEQPEAHYNLGYLAYEAAELASAVTYFERAKELDPAFADAYFNLAMALEDLGESARARPHWQSYLELDPEGPWAEIATRFLRNA